MGNQLLVTRVPRLELLEVKAKAEAVGGRHVHLAAPWCRQIQWLLLPP